MPQHDRATVLSVDEAAQALGRSPQTVRRLLQMGRLAGRKLGREWVIWWSTEEQASAAPMRRGQVRPGVSQIPSMAAVRTRLRAVGSQLIAVGNRVAQGRRRRGGLFLTWRAPQSLRVILAMGRESPSTGWSPYALGVEMPFWLEERPRWRQVMPLLRRYERVRSWCAPQLLRIPGVSDVVFRELQQVEAALDALDKTASVR
jgi:excisionase family DNA binding protein